MNLHAYVNHKFDKGFLLKDEDLTKLLDFVKVRANEVSAAGHLMIKVYRSDSVVYESLNLEALRTEENAVRNRLTRVLIMVDHIDLKVNLDFDAEENIWIRIESSDRDRAYLLFSELKEYLNTEVLVLRKRASRESLLLGMTVSLVGIMCMLLALMLWVSRPSLSAGQMKSLLAGDDIHAKLNYLIGDRIKQSEAKLLLVMVPAMLLPTFAYPILSRLRNHWYPRNVFYFGKEKQRYDSLLERRSRWIWGVVVGFIISFLSGLAIWFLPTR